MRRAIAGVGGYWQPLAGVARLLEELGEVADLLADEVQAQDAPLDRGLGSRLEGELADLWIITTAIADQFLAHVAEPGSSAKKTAIAAADAVERATPAGPGFRRLVVTAGQIARIVNYYDGPKQPRSRASMPSLADTVAAFHSALAAFASARAIDLAAAVAQKLAAIPTLDRGRFKASAHDPATAPALERFRAIAALPSCPIAPGARLWAGPDWRHASLAANIDALMPGLISFSKAAIAERLEGFLICAPAITSADQLRRWRRRALAEIRARDPRATNREPRGATADEGPDGRFEFNGLAISVALFSPAFAAGDARHSPNETAAVLCPLSSP